MRSRATGTDLAAQYDSEEEKEEEEDEGEGEGEGRFTNVTRPGVGHGVLTQLGES